MVIQESLMTLNDGVYINLVKNSLFCTKSARFSKPNCGFNWLYKTSRYSIFLAIQRLQNGTLTFSIDDHLIEWIWQSQICRNRRGRDIKGQLVQFVRPLGGQPNLIESASFSQFKTILTQFGKIDLLHIFKHILAQIMINLLYLIFQKKKNELWKHFIKFMFL